MIGEGEGSGSEISEGGQGHGMIHGGSSIMAVNECILRPNICGPGQCVDTVSGYKCICNEGYRLGKSHVCEGQ